jgi:hypothetical protein
MIVFQSLPLASWSAATRRRFQSADMSAHSIFTQSAFVPLPLCVRIPGAKKAILPNEPKSKITKYCTPIGCKNTVWLRFQNEPILPTVCGSRASIQAFARIFWRKEIVYYSHGGLGALALSHPRNLRFQTLPAKTKPFQAYAR